MYRRKQIPTFLWIAGILVIVILLAVLLGHLDFPGWIVRGLSSVVPSKPDTPHTEEQYQALNEKVNTLEQQNTYLNELLLEYKRQDNLSVVSQEIQIPTIDARVIYRDHARLYDTMVIDRGTHDGVKVGMPVVDANGLIGRITSITAATSHVALITSPDCSYGVIDQRSRDVGIVRGTRPVAWNFTKEKIKDQIPPDMLEFQYLSPSAQINVSDLLITSGLSGITPKGLRVGEVVEIIRREEEGRFDIRVRPFADFNHLENVEVVLFNEENPNLIPAPSEAPIQKPPLESEPSESLPPDVSEPGSEIAPSTPSTANEG
jgi:rod shape-determining protein MreC